jgi:NTE family protein
MNRKSINVQWTFGRLTAVVIITMVSSLGCGGPKQQKISVPDLPPPVAKRTKPVKVALVLSSGGFRGAAHLGAIEVFEEHGIPVDIIVGSSAGSFIGAFYADQPKVALIKDKLMSANYESLVDTSLVGAMQAAFYPTGPVRGVSLQNFMLKNMRSRDFKDLKIPLVVVTTSLMNNEPEVLQTGPIIPAVHASSALPPYFAPVRVYQNVFIDGAASSPVPVRVAKTFNPKIIIAVDITKKPSLTGPGNIFEITTRALDISFSELAKYQASEANFVIRPEIIGYGPFEDEYHEEFYQAGRKAALAQVDAIKAAYLKIK